MAPSPYYFESTAYGGTTATASQETGWAGSLMPWQDLQPGSELETQPFYYPRVDSALCDPSTGHVQSEGNVNEQASLYQDSGGRSEH